MIRFFFMLVITLHILPATAELSIDDIANLTGSPEQLSGAFKQEKFIKSFDAHIHSSGHFKYVRNQHIYWNTKVPVENQIIMTPTSITSTQGENELVNLQADKNPTIKVLSNIFFAVLTAEWQTLNEYFSSDIEGNTEKWSVMLIPKNKLLAQSINKVSLSGSSTLQTVTLYEKNGDSTHIVFSNLNQ